MMKYRKYNPNKKFIKEYGNRYYTGNRAGDCVIRAMTKAIGLDYLGVAELVAIENNKDIRKVVNGNQMPYKLLNQLGFKYFHNSHTFNTSFYAAKNDSEEAGLLFSSNNRSKMKSVYKLVTKTYRKWFAEDYEIVDWNVPIIWNFARPHVATSIGNTLYDSWDSRTKGVIGFWIGTKYNL